MKDKELVNNYNFFGDINYCKENIIYVDNKKYFLKKKPPYIKLEEFRRSVEIQQLLSVYKLSPPLLLNNDNQLLTIDSNIYFIQEYYGQPKYKERIKFHKKKYRNLIDSMERIRCSESTKKQSFLLNNFQVESACITYIKNKIIKILPGDLWEKVEDKIRFPSKKEVEQLKKSLVHGDLHLGNILNGKEGLKLIDFDESFYGYKVFNYAYFFAMCNFFDWQYGMYKISINESLKPHHISQYITSLNRVERKYLFSFITLATMQIVIDLSYDQIIRENEMSALINRMIEIEIFFDF